MLDDEVVGFTVAVRLAHGESHAGGFDGEDQLGHFAFAFRVRTGESFWASADRLGFCGGGRILGHKRRMRRHWPAQTFLLGFELGCSEISRTGSVRVKNKRRKLDACAFFLSTYSAYQTRRVKVPWFPYLYLVCYEAVEGN